MLRCEITFWNVACDKFLDFTYINHLLLKVNTAFILVIYIYKVYWLLFTKIKNFQKLINHPEMNCSMSIPLHHYVSNNT